MIIFTKTCAQIFSNYCHCQLVMSVATSQQYYNYYKNIVVLCTNKCICSVITIKLPISKLQISEKVPMTEKTDTDFEISDQKYITIRRTNSKNKFADK